MGQENYECLPVSVSIWRQEGMNKQIMEKF